MEIVSRVEDSLMQLLGVVKHSDDMIYLELIGMISITMCRTGSRKEASCLQTTNHAIDGSEYKAAL